MAMIGPAVRDECSNYIQIEHSKRFISGDRWCEKVREPKKVRLSSVEKDALSVCSIAFSGQWCRLAENESICPLSVPGLQLSSAHSASFPCFAYIYYTIGPLLIEFLSQSINSVMPALCCTFRLLSLTLSLPLIELDSIVCKYQASDC